MIGASSGSKPVSRRGVLASSIPVLSGCAGAPRTSRDRRRAGPVRVNRGETRPGADGRLGFVGDVMLGREVDEHWSDGPPGGVWDGLRGRLRGLDGLFLNLECCVSDRGDPRPSRTYQFRADPDWVVPALKAVDATWASLANNHVLDFGPVALSDTREHLDDAGVAHAGAGPDRTAALAPSVVTAGTLRVGVVAFTDRAPSYAAGPERPGTAFARLDPGDPVTRKRVGGALAAVRDADPDLVVASLHWGPNWEIRPADTQRAFARWLVDRGVDLVHGHSAHVIQGIECYRGRPICYDCGDFVDDYLFRDDRHNKRSCLFELRVVDGKPAAMFLHPVQIYDESVHPAGDAEAAWLREKLSRRSAAFGTTVERDGRGLVVPLSAEDCRATGGREERRDGRIFGQENAEK